MAVDLEHTALWRLTATGALKTLQDMPRWLRLRHDIEPNTTVPDAFFGINVATSDDPRCDDYTIAALRELGINDVRLGYSYDSVGAATERFLGRLLDEGFAVLLALLPARQDATALASDTAAQQRWASFVEQTVAQHGPRISAMEIGNTPNRGRWSGYNSQSYLAAWQLAAPAVRASGTPLAGPNVSDFEPIYNLGLLEAMRKLNSTPDIHTDNLFVERVVEPEIFDHRVANRAAARWLGLNLVKKSAVLADISRKYDVGNTWCTYTCWTRKRLNRWSVRPEQKQSHYLLRYLVLAAASGSLDRVYWGPLICHRDGLIDCGDTSYPEVDNVTYYRTVRGDVEEFKPNAAFHTLQHCVLLLRNATCLQAHNQVDGLHHFVFSSPEQGHWHVVWCGDRKAYPLAELYPSATLAAADCYAPDGARLPDVPPAVTEEPLILRWDTAIAAPSAEQLRDVARTLPADIVHWAQPGARTQVLQNAQWRGAYSVTATTSAELPDAATIPALLPTMPVLQVLRDKRNKLWNISAPWWSDGKQTVKLNRARGIKRLTYRFLPSKAKRHWNNATEMLRQGINTPQPLGFFEQRSSNAADSYYICQFIENGFSCRDVFTAFKAGHNEYRGIEKDEWLQRIGGFVAHMHGRGVIHRDLSSGNLMMTNSDAGIRFYLIDIGRAVIDRRRASTAGMRFKDLNRICYKLDWPDRERLIQAYDAQTNLSLPKWWRLSLSSYDWKQRSKKALKGQKKTTTALPKP